MDNMKKWNLVRNNKKAIIERAKVQNNDRAKMQNDDRASTWNRNPPQSKDLGQYQKLTFGSQTPGIRQWNQVPPQNSEDGRKIGYPYHQYPKSTVPHDERYQSSWHMEQEDFLNSLKWLEKVKEDRDTTKNLEHKEGGFLKQYHDSPQSVGSTNNVIKTKNNTMKTYELLPIKQDKENNSNSTTDTAGLLDMPKWECNTDLSKNTSRKGLVSQFQDGYQTDSAKSQLANKISPTDKKDNIDNNKQNIEKYEPRNTWIALKKDDEMFPEDVTQHLDENQLTDSKYLTEVWIHKNAQTQEIYNELPNGRRLIQQITNNGQNLVNKSVRDDVKLTKQILELKDVPKTKEEMKKYVNLQIVVLDHAQNKFIYPDMNFQPKLNRSNVDNKTTENVKNPTMPMDIISQLPKPEELLSIKSYDPITLSKLDELKTLYLTIYKVRETQIMMANMKAATNDYDQNYHEIISTIVNTDQHLKNILTDLIKLKQNQKHFENESFIETPTFGINDKINMKDLQALPTFDGENNEVPLYHFWQKMIQFIETQKISEKATKMILAYKLLGPAFDIFEINKENNVETIIKQLSDRYGSFPTKLEFEEQMNTFKRTPTESIKACMNRFEYILKKLYQNEPDFKQILEMKCNEMIRKLAIPETRPFLDRAIMQAKSHGQELKYLGKLNIIHREEELLKRNKTPEVNSLQTELYDDFENTSEDEANQFENGESNIAHLDQHDDEDDLSEDEEFLNSEDEYYSPNEDNDLDEQYFDTQDVQEYHAEVYENQGPQINTAEKWENQIDEAFKTAHIIVDIMQNTEDENDLVHKIVDILMEKTWMNW